MTVQHCIRCGAVFASRGRRHVYCSRRCREVGYLERTIPKVKTRIAQHERALGYLRGWLAKLEGRLAGVDENSS